MSFQFTTRRMLVWFVVAAVIFWVLTTLSKSFHDSYQAAFKANCQGGINQLRAAIEAYKDAKGSYPPLYIADANGKPMHSWRVLILPYIEERALYNTYNFNEPFNGPNNSKLASMMPNCFRCVLEPDANTTPYLLVSSPDNSQRLNNRGKNPIVLIELHSKGVNWLQPSDVSIDEVDKILSSRNTSKDFLHRGNPHGGRYYSKQGYIYVIPNILDDSDMHY